MTPQELRERESNLELINGEIASRMARQSEAGAKVDTKAVFVVGFAATAAQFLAARSFEPYTGTAAFVAYAVAIGTGISIFNLARYEDLDPRAILDDHGRDEKSATLVALASTRVTMFETNSEVHQRKTHRWTVSLVAVVVGICLSTVSIVLHTGAHDREPGKPGRPAPSASSSAQPH
ncbi:hypothetical protein TK78_05975 [Streptomyces sp. Tue 6075]|uniref:hypothetical protein n=1 Tax=Streptomyces sp. Tue 6075 TaxID=1661694 RepID=UPI00094A8094|nr:hypothetical protein [Streptomyces sp. Tue 6075]APS18548.1 hypothetical protein TK78_05975 [Streptomyces sp. Tue 6075]